jgi:hypothetical protein
MTLMADMRAVTHRSSIEPDDAFNSETQQTKVTAASIITQGAKIDAMRSVLTRLDDVN